MICESIFNKTFLSTAKVIKNCGEPGYFSAPMIKCYASDGTLMIIMLQILIFRLNSRNMGILLMESAYFFAEEGKFCDEHQKNCK